MRGRGGWSDLANRRGGGLEFEGKFPQRGSTTPPIASLGHPSIACNGGETFIFKFFYF